MNHTNIRIDFENLCIFNQMIFSIHIWMKTWQADSTLIHFKPTICISDVMFEQNLTHNFRSIWTFFTTFPKFVRKRIDVCSEIKLQNPTNFFVVNMFSIKIHFQVVKICYDIFYTFSPKTITIHNRIVFESEQTFLLI